MALEYLKKKESECGVEIIASDWLKYVNPVDWSSFNLVVQSKIPNLVVRQNENTYGHDTGYYGVLSYYSGKVAHHKCQDIGPK